MKVTVRHKGNWGDEEWASERILKKENGSILFEVAKNHNHCPTCAERLRYVENVLDKKNVKYSFRYSKKGSRTFLELEAPNTEENIRTYVGELLNLVLE